MHGDEAMELLRELKRNAWLPPFNVSFFSINVFSLFQDEGMRKVIGEMDVLQRILVAALEKKFDHLVVLPPNYFQQTKRWSIAHCILFDTFCQFDAKQTLRVDLPVRFVDFVLACVAVTNSECVAVAVVLKKSKSSGGKQVVSRVAFAHCVDRNGC